MTGYPEVDDLAAALRVVRRETARLRDNMVGFDPRVQNLFASAVEKVELAEAFVVMAGEALPKQAQEQ